ncbi:MAG: response regulator [Bryobacteraceae bacterium]
MDLFVQIGGAVALTALAVLAAKRVLRGRRFDDSGSRFTGDDRARSLFEAAPVGYLDVDSMGVIREINSKECDLRGIHREHALGKSYWDLEAPDVRERHKEQLLRKLNGELDTGTIERKHLRPDGSITTVELREDLLRERGGKIAGLRFTSIDNSDRAQKEEEAFRSTSELRAIFRTFPDLFFRLDAKGSILEFQSPDPNDPRRSELIGKRMQDVMACDGQDRLGPAIEKVLKKGATVTVEFPLNTRIGQQHFEARLAPGHWGEVIVLVRNINERKEAEEKLQRFAEELEEKNGKLASALVAAREATRLKSNFLANMSHEIRTPMNGVLGMTELLLASGLNSEQRDYAEMVKQAADGLLRIINDILDLSKIEAGKLKIESVPFDPENAVEAALASITLQAQAKGLTVQSEIDPGVPRNLRGDPGRLRQVMTNLLGNAVKFTERGGVTLRLELAGETPDTCTLRFKVEDTGVGIQPEQFPKLFQSFVQGDGSSTRRFGGTGLGLSISRQLVEMMGGDIGANSNAGGSGSIFWFTAIVEKYGAKDAAPPVTDEWAGLKNEKVLIASDTARAVAIIRRNLDAWGCRYAEVASGEHVLPQLRQAALEGNPYRIALISLDLPEMDGFAVGRAIKYDAVTRDTILIALASAPMRDQVLAMRAIGFADCVSEPIRPIELHGAMLESIDAGAHPDAAARSLVRAAGRTEPVRVLLAEDNSVNQKFALRLLERAGLKVDTVLNGREAVEAVSKAHYDLVLMDIQMPHMDGLEATAEIRKSEANGTRTPIVALTACAMEGDRERCIAVGMDDYISKPFNSQVLQEALDRWIGPLNLEPPPALDTRSREAPPEPKARAAAAGSTQTEDGGFRWEW